jgi:ribose-phosphate pyrophosphokinase
MILGFADYRSQAQGLANTLQLEYREIEVHRFPDGECKVRLPRKLPQRVLFCRTLDRPDSKLLELLLASATARELGARELTLVAPYLCYMRQDTAFQPGESVSQRIVGRFLAGLFDNLITVDPHLHRVPDLPSAIPAHRALAISAAPLMAQFLGAFKDAPLLLGPDQESAQWVAAIAGPQDLDYGVCRKTRSGDRQVRVELTEFEPAGRRVVLVDDVLSTGHTLAEAARQCLARGARRVDVLVTHALFASGAAELIRAAGISEVWSSDSISHPTNRILLADLLGAAVRRLS